MAKAKGKIKETYTKDEFSIVWDLDMIKSAVDNTTIKITPTMIREIWKRMKNDSEVNERFITISEEVASELKYDEEV